MYTEASPFRSDLKPFEKAHGRMWEFPLIPPYIVRIEDYGYEGSVNEAIQTLSGFRGLVAELESDYGVKNPGYWPVIISETEETRYVRPVVVTSRVYGVGLPQAIEKSVPGLLDDVDTLYSSLARYLGDKYKNRKPYMNDIYGSHQYMYGRTEDSSEDGIILVDIGIGVNHVYTEREEKALENPERTAYHFDLYDSFTCLRAIQLYEDVTSISRKTGRQFKAYEDIMRLLNSFVIKNSRANESIALINDAHAHGKFVAQETIQTLEEGFLESD